MSTETWWKVSWGSELEQVEVTRHTDSSVWVQTRIGERRKSRQGEDRYFPSRNEALSYIRGRLEKELAIRRSQVLVLTTRLEALQ